MGLAISYKSICRTFGANTNAVEREMRKKIMTHRIFILYDNINFYAYMYNACIFNGRVKINYIVGYIYLLGPYE